MVWGNNVVVSNPDCYKGEPFSQALDAGAKLIAVDPRLTRIAARADIWLPLRPGTDTALALGMLHVIVNEQLYDRAFVENQVSARAAIRVNLGSTAMSLAPLSIETEKGSPL